MSHRAAKWVYLLFFVAMTGYRLYSMTTWSIEFANAVHFQEQSQVSAFVDFHFAHLLSLWNLVPVAILALFFFRESRRVGVRHWWLFLLLGIVIHEVSALMLFLFVREQKLEQSSSLANEPAPIGAYSLQSLYMFAIVAAAIHFTGYRLYLFFSHYLNDIMRTGLNMDLFAEILNIPPIWGLPFLAAFSLPMVLFFTIERTRREIHHWWLAVPAEIIFGFTLSLPLFMFSRESTTEHSGSSEAASQPGPL